MLARLFPVGIQASEEYRRAAHYLQLLADRSGGRLYDANTLYNVSQAFSNIAEELRHQYALSYYPSNSKKDGAYRRVKVRSCPRRLSRGGGGAGEKRRGRN